MVPRPSPAEFQCQLGHGTLPLLPCGPEWWRGRDWRFSSAWGSTTSRRSALVRKPLGSMPHFVTALTAGAAAEMGIAATRTSVNRQQRRPWQSTLEAVRTKQSRRLVTFASAASGMALAGAVLAAPPANAGRQYGGIAISECDGPVQPDGTWQRCVEFFSTRGSGSGSFNDRRCDLMGPDLHPWGLAFADPPTHIDD